MASKWETFSIIFDYVVFAIILLVSLGIGLFYSFRQKNTEEYVHGSRQMGLIPSSISLVVSYVSAMTLQGIPAEIYIHGIEIIFSLFAAFGMLLVIVTFLPIYYEMKPTSIFQYLEKRFNSKVPKLLGTWLNILCSCLYAGIICFGPAAAIESLTDIPTEINIVAMAVISMIYTSIGGIKAVIWTDVFQAAIMILGLIVVLVVGMCNIDTSIVWQDLSRYGRTTLNLEPTITQRSSVWIFVFVSAIQRYSMFIDQPAMIRYTGLPTLQQARCSIILSTIGFVILMILSMAVGVVVLAYYAQRGCGPLAAEEIYSPNQIVPYFVISVINYPGVPGLFISATVASTLSSISSTQNAIATIFWKDVLSKYMHTSEFIKTLVLKITVIVFGLIIMGISFLAMYGGGTLYHASAVVLGFVAAPPLGMFLLGASFTFTSSVTVVIGCLCSMAFCLWLSLGKLLCGTTWKEPTLIDDMCHLYNNSTLNTTISPYYNSSFLIDNNTTFSTDSKYQETAHTGLMQFYSISAYAYPLIGSGITFIIGLILSFLPCLRNKDAVSKDLLFPFVRRFVTDPGHSKNVPELYEQTLPLQHTM